MKRFKLLTFVALSFLIVGIFYYFANKRLSVGTTSGDKDIILISPNPNQTIDGPILIKGRARNMAEGLVYYYLVDANEGFGLDAGSIWVTDVQKDGYGNFEASLKFYNEYNSGKAVLSVFMYTDNTYETRKSEIKVPVKLLNSKGVRKYE